MWKNDQYYPIKDVVRESYVNVLSRPERQQRMEKINE
jgi:hypothetical protein